MKKKIKIKEFKISTQDRAEIARMCGRKRGWFPSPSHFPAKKRLPEVR